MLKDQTLKTGVKTEFLKYLHTNVENEKKELTEVQRIV